MYQKASQVLDLLERFVNIIRTKAHNKVANMVIGAGILQIAEAHAKILHAFSIALFEEYIAKSDILREFLNTTSDSTTGLIMIAMGLAYHLVASLGKYFIDAIKTKQPKIPKIQLQLLNGDKEALSAEFILRGLLSNTPDQECIPDNKENEDTLYQNSNLPSGIVKHMQSLYKSARPYGMNKNIHKYRERASIIDKWAGSELIYISLRNLSSVLVNDIRIELHIPKKLSNVSIEDKFLSQPEDITNELSFLHDELIYRPKPISIYDNIKMAQTTNNFILSWKAHKLHGETSIESSECFLLKVTEETTIECTVYCDELPKPYEMTFKVKPPQKSINVSLDELIDDQCYDALLNRVVMDGYVSRVTNDFQL